MSIATDHFGGLLGAASTLPLLWLLLHCSPLQRAWAQAPPAARIVSGVLLGDGLLHLGMAPGHAAEAPGLALAFGLDGLLLVAAFGVPLALSRWRAPAGILLTGNLIAYALVIGSGREGADEVGILSKLAELVALGLVLIPAPGRRAGVWRRGLRWSGAAFAMVLLSAATGTVAWGSELKSAGHIHGGPLVPTPAERVAAAGLVEQTAAGIARFQDPAVALADGYRPGQLAKGEPTSHWSNPRYNNDRHVLDTRHPQTLVYANTKHGPLLLGAMYAMPHLGEAGPRPGGPITAWHTHPNLCFLPWFQITAMLSPFGQCPPLTFNLGTSEMIHVWTAGNPNGPYGDLSDAWVRRLVAA